MNNMVFWTTVLILLAGLGCSEAQPANDDFTNAVQLTGTNFSYSGNFDGATMEPGEPYIGASNTVWQAWVAPADGYITFSMNRAAQFQFYCIYTGSSVGDLQPVNPVPLYANNQYRYTVSQGVIYSIQVAGGADNYTFNLSFQQFGPCANDDFTNAAMIFGQGFHTAGSTVNGATMEMGEPQHYGNIPQKSIWWEWQAPNWGTVRLDPSPSLVTNYCVAVYSGQQVDGLSLVGKGTNAPFLITVTGGKIYWIAGAVPTNEDGDIMLISAYAPVDSSAHTIPGNLLLEPSWEGTGLNPLHWGKTSSGIGGYVNEQFGGADGQTWPDLANGAAIWQRFATIPGHTYEIKFAYMVGGQLSQGGGDATVAVWWNTNLVANADIPGAESGFWHWGDYFVTATTTTSLLAFTNLARSVDMDAFSVADASAPPAIISEPAPASSPAGGAAAFSVAATGTPPLTYQWWFNSTPVAGQTNRMLVFNPVAMAEAGNYYVTITNGYGAVTSSVAALAVNQALSATILSQPYGDTVPVGGYYNFSVVGAGTPPLAYQWYFNGVAIGGATNTYLMLTNVDSTYAGTYTVQVSNNTSVTISLPATLTVDASAVGGGLIDFRNGNFPGGQTNLNAPIYDLDGATPLNGGEYAAQLYAGPTLAELRAIGSPTPFQQGFTAGYFVPQTVTLANVMPGSNAVVQVRAWDTTYGNSYEQARATGGRAGESGVLQMQAGGGAMPAKTIPGLQSFSLQAGLPYFQVGKISLVGRQPPHQLIWSLEGQAGSIYLIEQSDHVGGTTIWTPFQTVTNVTGTVIFTNMVDSSQGNVYFRARILD